MDKNLKISLSVHITTPEAVVFEGEVKALSSFNENGLFDILPMHENFISMIREKVVVYPLSGEKQEVEIEKGVLKVIANEVHIFLGI